MKKLIFMCLVVSLGGILSAQTDPQWLWATSAGSAGNDISYSISRDNYGYLYVTGFFLDTAQFGGTHLTTLGSNEIFVAKLDANGNWLWAVRAGGTGDDKGMSISTDGDGNSYVTGYFSGTADFGSTTLTSAGSADIFIAKLDPSGNWLWAKRAGGPYEDWGNIVAFDNGYCYLTGRFQGTSSFGALTVSSAGSHDIFVARLDTNGNWFWVRSAGGTSWDEGDCVSTDAGGNCYVSGYVYGAVNLGPLTLDANGDDAFVAKLDPDGNWLWANCCGGSGLAGAWSVSTDDSGNSAVTGPFTGTAIFGTTTLQCSGSYDIFIARMDNEGNWVWARRAGGNYVMADYTDVGCCISLDNNGDCYVNGYYYGAAADFGTIVLPNGGFYNLYVTKLDIDGNWLWAITVAGISNDSCWGFCLDGEGNGYGTGAFSGTTDFGATSLTSAGERDIWVGKLSSGVGIDDDLAPDLSGVSSLSDAWPNPFRVGATATIKAHVAERENGILTLYNLRGQIIQSQQLDSGPHEIVINGADLPAGIYLYQLKTPSSNSTKKLVLLK